jgi:hypothetical protein
MKKSILTFILLWMPFQAFSHQDDFYIYDEYKDIYMYADKEINLICEDLIQYPKHSDDQNLQFLQGRLSAFFEIREYCLKKIN